jgi:hypothetical protein
MRYAKNIQVLYWILNVNIVVPRFVITRCHYLHFGYRGQPFGRLETMSGCPATSWPSTCTPSRWWVESCSEKESPLGTGCRSSRVLSMPSLCALHVCDSLKVYCFLSQGLGLHGLGPSRPNFIPARDDPSRLLLVFVSRETCPGVERCPVSGLLGYWGGSVSVPRLWSGPRNRRREGGL